MIFCFLSDLHAAVHTAGEIITFILRPANTLAVCMVLYLYMVIMLYFGNAPLCIKGQCVVGILFWLRFSRTSEVNRVQDISLAAIIKRWAKNDGCALVVI